MTTKFNSWVTCPAPNPGAKIRLFCLPFAGGGASAYRQWDDTTTGSLMFCLATEGYTPNAAHTTTNDLGANIVTDDGAPIVVATPTIDAATTPGTTYYNSDSADFGTSVSITAKYLICVQPVTANTFSSTTSKLLWYVDLNTLNGTATVSSTASEFKVDPATNGWFKMV